MKNASWSLFVVLFASLSSWESIAQVRPLPGYQEPRNPRDDYRPGPGRDRPRDPRIDPFPQEERIEARIQQTVRRGTRLLLSQYLYTRDPYAQIVSLSVTAQSFSGPATLQLSSRSSILELIPVRRQLREIPVRAILLESLESLELGSLDDIYIESISAVVRSSYYEPLPQEELQVSPNSLVTVRVNQDIHSGEIPLARLVKEQLGLSLEGAQIERVAVEGMPIGRAASSVHVELNNRIASQIKYLSAAQARLPLQVTSLEEVRSLRLVVSGSARILDVNIRVGNVRPIYNRPIPRPMPLPIPSRILVNQEVSPSYPLDLAILTRELSLARSLRIETNLRPRIAANLTLINRYGQTVGRAMISAGSTIVILSVPTALADIQIYTDFNVHISHIEAELDRPTRW